MVSSNFSYRWCIASFPALPLFTSRPPPHFVYSLLTTSYCYIHTIHQTIHLLLKDSNLPKTSRALSKCAYTCAHCRPMIDGLNHFFMRHLSLFYNKIADNLRLGRARIAAVENQVWWTVLPPSLYRILSSMDW